MEWPCKIECLDALFTLNPHYQDKNTEHLTLNISCSTFPMGHKSWLRFSQSQCQLKAEGEAFGEVAASSGSALPASPHHYSAGLRSIWRAGGLRKAQRADRDANSNVCSREKHKNITWKPVQRIKRMSNPTTMMISVNCLQNWVAHHEELKIGPKFLVFSNSK